MKMRRSGQKALIDRTGRPEGTDQPEIDEPMRLDPRTRCCVQQSQKEHAHAVAMVAAVHSALISKE